MLTSFSILCAIRVRKTFFCSQQMENPVAEYFWMLSQAFFSPFLVPLLFSSLLYLPQTEASFAQIWRIFDFTMCLKNKSDLGDTKHTIWSNVFSYENLKANAFLWSVYINLVQEATSCIYIPVIPTDAFLSWLQRKNKRKWIHFQLFPLLLFLRCPIVHLYLTFTPLRLTRLLSGWSYAWFSRLWFIDWC